MKRKLFISLFIGLLFLGTALTMTSCSDSSDDFVETAWNIENFTVNASQWSWNSNMNRWEAVKQLNYIDEFIYESGAVIGYVFLGTQNTNEIQVPMPYIRSYIEDNGEDGVFVFTETISFEYSHLTNRVTFFIEPSDGFKDESAKQNYNFRIVMIR